MTGNFKSEFFCLFFNFTLLTLSSSNLQDMLILQINKEFQNKEDMIYNFFKLNLSTFSEILII